MKKIIVTGIGADIEVFLKEKETDRIVSAEGYIKGSKYDPFIFDENRFFSTSLDNVLAEFTIPPATSVEDFLAYVKKGVAFINDTIPQTLCTAAIPAAMLEDEFVFTENAMRFGCEPDFNAYTKSINERNFMVDYRLRSGGGHIHIGYSDATPFKEGNYKIDDERLDIIKALDLFIGVPSVIMEPDNKRKELYGAAGAFRPKSYGVEYRTVSNYYLQSDELTQWVYTSAEKAIAWLNSVGAINEELSARIVNTINTCDREQALELISENNLILV